MTATSHDQTTATGVISARGPGRTRMVAVCLAASAVTLAALVLTHPWGPRLDSSSAATFSYDLLKTNRDAAWPATMLDAFAFGVLTICVALAAGHLVRGRGRLAATIGGVATVAGGVLFAMGAAGSATLTWYVTSTALSEESGRDLIAFMNDHPGHVLVPQTTGFFLVTLGTLVLTAALVHARVVPRLAGAAFVLLTVALFAVSGQAMNAVQAAQMLLIGAIAIPLWRRAG